jgi:hypothetical protein
VAATPSVIATRSESEWMRIRKPGTDLRAFAARQITFPQVADTTTYQNGYVGILFQPSVVDLRTKRVLDSNERAVKSAPARLG